MTDNCYEVSYEIASMNYPCRFGWHLFWQGFHKYILDMAFVIEGVTDDELPEQVLGAFRGGYFQFRNFDYLHNVARRCALKKQDPSSIDDIKTLQNSFSTPITTTGTFETKEGLSNTTAIKDISQPSSVSLSELATNERRKFTVDGMEEELMEELEQNSKNAQE